MNIAELVKTHGLVEVKNPNYNPRAKKNKQPKTIMVRDTSYHPSAALQGLHEATKRDYAISSDITQKYREHGLTYNPNKDMDSILADKQSNWEKARNALYQTVVSEIGLGTLRGVSDLFDFVGSTLFKPNEDNDYTNPVSQKLQEWQEDFKNNYDIYTKPGTDISNGGLLDFGWWMQNVPSIASSLTLLIPSTGATKLLGMVGKASKATKLVGNTRKLLIGINKVDKVENAAAELGQVAKLTTGQKFAKWANRQSTIDKANQIVEYGINGFTSRIMENYQEANQVYNDMLPQILNGDKSRGIQGINDMSDAEYNDLVERNKDILEDVDVSDRKAVAKKLAKESADETFKIDMINGFFDVYELYGLRNIKRFMNGPMRASVRRDHLNSMKYAGKTKEEIKDILSKRSFWEKTKDKAGDILYGSRTAIGAQLSEGIEEAINYIAQEEGMNYGNALIADAPQSPFDTRLKNYLNNPQLYESAFWGVMGGVIFQGAGSGLVRVKHAADVKRNEKKYALNEETQEQRKKVPWAEAFEMPEITARKKNIEARAIGMNTLKSELEQIIDKGVNPWEKENGQNKTLDSNEEKKVAKDRAYRKYATGLLMDSMFCGNWNITRAYLESDEVRDALVQAGVLSQSEATQRQAEVKQLAEQLEDSYDRNMRVVENVMRGNINGVDLDDTPMEYLQIIAAENMRHELDAQQFGRNIAQYEPVIGSEEERLADELKQNGIDYKQAIRSFILARNLGQINAELEAARKSKKEGRSEKFDARSISGQTAIRELELRKKVLENMISQVYTPLDTKGLKGSEKKAVENANKLNGAATTLVTLRAIAATEATPEGRYTMNLNSKRYKNVDDVIVKAFNFNVESNPNGWQEHQKALATLNESLGTLSAEEFKQVAQLADIVNENIAAVLGENGAAESLKNLSETLLNSYAAVTNNEIARQIELAQIVKKRTDVREAVHRKHNEITSMRGVMLELANNTLKGIAKKYYEQNPEINRLLAYGTIDDAARETLKSLLDDADMKDYDDAMRIFALQRKDKRGNTKQAVENSLLPEMIEDALYESSRDEYEDYDENLLQSSEEEVEQEPKQETKKKSTTSQKSKSEPKKSSSNKNTQEDIEASREEGNGKIVDFNYSKGGKKLTTPRGAIYLNDDGTIDHFEQSSTTSNADVQVTMKPVEGEEGVYELDFKTDLNNDGIDSTNEVFTNGKLFSINTPIIDGGQVINNPRVVVNDDGTVEQFTPGEIDNPEREGVEQEENDDSQTERDASLSSTGEETDEVNPDTFNEGNEEESSDEEQPVREILDPSDVFGTAVRIIKRRAATGEEFTDEDIYNDLVEEYKDKNNEEGLQEALKLVKKRIKQVINKLNANVKEVDDLFSFIEASSLSDVDPAAKDKADLDDLFDNIVDNFCKRAAFSEHNGRKIISLENLLRYCNELTNDKMMANLLYDKFVNIIRENDYKYRIVENYNLLNGKLDKDNILQNASKSQEERLDELDNPNGRDLDSGFVLKGLSYAQKEKVYDILDSLKPDDELEIRREEMHGTEEGRTTIYFIKNGVEVASIPTPRITSTGYEQITSFWITDIPTANDGSQSKLEQLFVRIMLNPDNEEGLKDVAAAIRKAYYTPRKEKDEKGKVKGTNPEYIKACREVYDLLEKVVNLNDYLDLSYTKKDKNGKAINQTLDEKIHEAINHVINVYGGVKTNSEQWLGKSGITKEEYDKAIMKRRKDSIHRWFKRLKDSYSTIVELADNNDTVVKVDTVNQGGAIIVPKEEAQPVNKKGVIGSAHKGKLDLVVASITEVGKVYSTNGSSMTMGAMSPGSTFLSIPHNSGTPALIHAFPQSIGASHLTAPMKEIQKEILNELNRIITAWATDVNVTVKELEDFLTTLCSHRGGNNPLLRGFKIDRLTGGKNGRSFEGLQITYKDENGKNHYIKFFDSNEYGLASVIRFDNETPYAFKKDKNLRKKTLDRIGEIANSSLEYNLEFDYIKGTRSLRGYAKRGTKGQFIVQIPNGKVHSFKSYKDFVINNGLISVTTKTNNGKTNYYRPKESSNPKDNPRITYKLANKAETPRRKEVSSTSEPEIVKGKGEVVKAMIEAHGNENDIIKKVLTSVLDDDRLKILKDSKLFDELLKGNLKFGRLPNNTFGGHIKNTTSYYGVTYQQGDIVMSQRWIDYLNSDNPEEVEEAVTHLIHESIHRKLKTLPKAKYDALMKEIGEIFEEFVAANEADGLPANEGVRQYEFKDGANLERNRYTNGKLNTLGCEEFLIESITKKAVIKRLNEIAASGETINKRSRLGSLKSKSLLQRILTALAKILNLNINKGSLLAKEYKMFETFGLTSSSTEEKTEPANTSPNITFASKEQESSYNAVAKLEQFSNDNIKFDKKNHQYSVFGVPTQYSVTQYAEKVFGKRTVRGNYDHSTAIGSSYDALWRDYFDGVDILSKEYPNFNEQRKKDLIKDFERFKKYIEDRFGKGCIIKTKEFYLAGTIKNDKGEDVSIAGAIDMMVIAPNGDIHIFDMKAKNHDIDATYKGKPYDDRRDYTAQQNLYRAIIESNPELEGKVKSLNLIWGSTSYPSIDNVDYAVEDDGTVTIQNDDDTVTKLEDFDKFITPRLKPDINESIIPIEVTDTVNNTPGKSQNKKLIITDVQTAIPVQTEVQEEVQTEQQLELDFTESTEETTQEQPVVEEQEKPIGEQSLDELIATDDEWDDVEDSSLTDISHPIVSLAQVRDSIIPENRETFERLKNTGGIEINC